MEKTLDVEEIRRAVLAMERPERTRFVVVDASGEVLASTNRVRFDPTAEDDEVGVPGVWMLAGIGSLDHIGTLPRSFTLEEAARLRFPVPSSDQASVSPAPGENE